ncbi:hypothetical protein CE91St51_49340 [[Clostridium] innocuum]|nr:hypothetical protein CE91St51_49340 [[Clostridium] innocuum]
MLSFIDTPFLQVVWTFDKRFIPHVEKERDFILYQITDHIHTQSAYKLSELKVFFYKTNCYNKYNYIKLTFYT